MDIICLIDEFWRWLIAHNLKTPFLFQNVAAYFKKRSYKIIERDSQLQHFRQSAAAVQAIAWSNKLVISLIITYFLKMSA